MSMIAVLQQVPSSPLVLLAGVLCSCTVKCRPLRAPSVNSEVTSRCSWRHRRKWSRKVARSSFAAKAGACQVDFLNVAILVQRRVADRCRVVKVDIAIVLLLQTPILGFKLLALQLKLFEQR
jgi:hypothetical protein